MCIAIFLGVIGSVVALSFGMAWLTINWWLPFTKIECNGMAYRVLQLNVFRLWQEIDRYDYNELSNLVTACKECNSGKSDRTIYNSASEKVQA